MKRVDYLNSDSSKTDTEIRIGIYSSTGPEKKIPGTKIHRIPVGNIRCCTEITKKGRILLVIDSRTALKMIGHPKNHPNSFQTSKETIIPHLIRNVLYIISTND